MLKIRILVVDDDPDICLALRIRLEANGYNVVAVRNVLSALEEALRQPPALILLDLGFPGLDGFFMLNQLQSIDNLLHIPVIVFSAFDDKRYDSLKAGAQAFLHKTATHAVLLSSIRQYVT